jgi:hypothetical protein
MEYSKEVWQELGFASTTTTTTTTISNARMGEHDSCRGET